MKNRTDRIYLIFLLPSVILFCFVIVYPFLSGVHLAFTDWDGISKTYNFVGLDNFLRMFRDTSFLKPIIFTVKYAVLYTTLNNVFALGIAVLLNGKLRGKNVCKIVFFVPMALSAVLAAFVWGFIDRSVITALLGTKSLLGSPDTVLVGIIIIALWNAVGSNIMIYTAGLTNISQDYYEACAIDGASAWKKFRYITLPLLGPSFTMCITLTLTSSLREFAMVMAATGGGPAKSSETISLFIYSNLFTYQRAGYGQAISFVFMIVLVVLGTGLSRFFRSKEVEM